MPVGKQQSICHRSTSKSKLIVCSVSDGMASVAVMSHTESEEHIHLIAALVTNMGYGLHNADKATRICEAKIEPR